MGRMETERALAIFKDTVAGLNIGIHAHDPLARKLPSSTTFTSVGMELNTSGPSSVMPLLVRLRCANTVKWLHARQPCGPDQ